MLQESELVQSQEDYSPVTLRGNFQSLGLSGVNRLYTDDSFGGVRNLELSVAEAWHSQRTVNSAEGVVDSLQVSANHVRITFETSHDHSLGAGGAVSPSISIGLRGDGRNE